MIAVFGEKRKDVYEAADYVRDVGEATGEYDLKRVHLEGVPVGDVETDYLEYEGCDLEDWPWDNGTARVLVDGCHVTEDEA